MEVEKRKRGDDGEADGKRTRVVGGEEDGGGVTAEPAEDEVEEFYAILKRIRVAVEYFEKGNGGEGRRRRLTTAANVPSSSSRWTSPSFRKEDFEEGDDGVKGTGEVEEEDTGLDLNADPESEPSSS